MRRPFEGMPARTLIVVTLSLAALSACHRPIRDAASDEKQPNPAGASAKASAEAAGAGLRRTTHSATSVTWTSRAS